MFSNIKLFSKHKVDTSYVLHVPIIALHIFVAVCDFKTYLAIGKVIAYSIVHRGPVPNFFSSNFYDFLVFGKVENLKLDDIEEIELRNKVRKVRVIILLNHYNTIATSCKKKCFGAGSIYYVYYLLYLILIFFVHRCIYVLTSLQRVYISVF